MFANFEKAFSEDEIEEHVSKKIIESLSDKLPKEIIESLSDKLPEGFEYRAGTGGSCGIVPKSSELSFGFKVEVPDDLFENFKPSNTEELMEFMYRTQRNFKVVTDKEGCISINGVKFKIEDIVKFPLENITAGKEWFIRPRPLEPPFKVPIIGPNSVIKSILIQRQPYPDMHKSYFKSVDKNVFEISYLIDEKNSTIKFKVHINIQEFNSVKEILDGFELYKRLIQGKETFAGYDISKGVIEDKIIEKTVGKNVEFWDKVYKLELKFGVKFSLDLPIIKKDVILVEKLYRSFIEEKPYKIYVDIEEFTLDNKGELDKKKIMNEKNIVLQLVQQSTQELWGNTFNMYDSISLVDFKILDIVLTKDMKKYKFLFEPATDNGIYEVVRHFVKKEEALKYQKCKVDFKNIEMITVDY